MDSSFESNNTLKIVLNEAEALPPVVNDTGSVPNIEPETIFIWIDILGFSSLVENEARYNELLVLLKEFYNAFNNLNSNAKCHRISDGIILKLNPDIRSADAVKLFFNNIMKVQNTFLLKQRFVRGGIAVGSKFNIIDRNDDFYISNGLARAYNLEANSITWPIIGTNKDYLDRICTIYGEIIKESFDVAYSKNKEEIYYLNSYKLLNNKDLCIVYNNVLTNISNTEKDPRVQQKYIWLQKIMEKINNALISLRCLNCKEVTDV